MTWRTPKRQCGARAKSTGQPCGKPAGWGTQHQGYGSCKLHGGCTPSGIKVAEREMAETAVATYGLPREVSPHEALEEELHRTAGAVAWLGQQVADLERDQVTHLIVAGSDDSGDRELVIDERPSVWVELYQRERKHFAAVAKTCADAGIDERRIRLAEDQGALLAQVIRSVITALGHRADDPQVRDVVRRELTLVAGGTP